MITIFRKIRQNLLSKNKFGKYLFYAIGEIVLVVIGILLALQINNWNEFRKDRVYEKQALKELYASLKGDARFNKAIMTNIESRDKAINYVISFLDSRHIETDSIFMNYLYESCRDHKINVDNGAYEALKSKGLEYIMNDSLRTHIIRTYEVAFPRTIFFGDEKRSDAIMKKKDQLFEFISDIEITLNDEYSPLTESITLDSTEKRTALIRLMKQQINLSNRYKELLGRQLKYINELLLAVNIELKKMEG